MVREWSMRWGLVAGGIVVAGVAFIGTRMLTHRGAETGLDLAFQGLPPGFVATHGPVTFNPVTGTAHLEKLVVTRDGALFASVGALDATGIGSVVGGMPVRIGHVTLQDVAGSGPYRHFDRIEIDGLETRNIRELFDPVAYPGGKPAWTERRPLVGSLDAFGSVVHVEPAADSGKHNRMKPFDVTVRHMRYEGLSGRQFAAPPTPERMKHVEFATDLAQSLAEHAGSAEGIEAFIPDAGTVTVGSTGTHDYDGGKFADAEIDTIAFVSAKEKGTATLDRIKVSGADFTRSLAMLPAIVADPQKAPPGLGGTISRISVSGLKADFEHAPLITLNSIETHTDYPSDTLSSGTGRLQGLNIVTTGRALPEKDMEGLREFGMADFTIDIDGEGSFDYTTGHAVVSRENIVLKDLGALHLTFDLDGLKFDQTDPVAMQRSARAIRINHADLRWDDASLTSRIFKLAAARTGQSEDALRSTLSLSLIGLAAYLPDQPDAADQVNAFLDGRHSLDITIAPAAPVSVEDLAAAGGTEKAHLLGVRIKGN